MLKITVKFLLMTFPESLRFKLYRFLATTFKHQFPIKNMFQHINLIKDMGFTPSFIIDVGAYIGDWTKDVIKIFPESKFLMVEPQPSKSSRLTNFANSHHLVSFESKLVGESEKRDVKFFDMETGSSIYEENTSFGRSITYLPMTTLDKLAIFHELKGEGLLKLDVQGAELDVLKGAKNILSSIEFLLLEVSTLNYNQGAPLVAEVISLLDGIGYCIFDICDERRTENNVLFQIDILFVKKSSKYRAIVDFK